MFIDLLVTAIIISLAVAVIYLDAMLTREQGVSEKLKLQVRRVVLNEAAPDLTADGHISRLEYCLTCHVLKPTSHFALTEHLSLEDRNLLGGS